MIEHSANLRFGTVDQLLVDQSADDAGLNLLEVPHEAPIVAIEAPIHSRLYEKADAGRVILFEVGKAARHRVAARIDDPRVRQSKADQRQVHPISRQLVDEVRAIRLPEWREPARYTLHQWRALRRGLAPRSLPRLACRWSGRAVRGGFS